MAVYTSISGARLVACSAFFLSSLFAFVTLLAAVAAATTVVNGTAPDRNQPYE